jgi:hypothetical protein
LHNKINRNMHSVEDINLYEILFIFSKLKILCCLKIKVTCNASQTENFPMHKINIINIKNIIQFKNLKTRNKANVEKEKTIKNFLF